MSETYSIAIPVRCKSCQEVSTKVETELPVKNLPECPNCDAPHFGGGGETEITPEEDEEEEEFDTDNEAFKDGYRSAESDIKQAIVSLLEHDSDFSPSYALDYIMLEEYEMDVDRWAGIRGVSKNTVKYNANQVSKVTQDED